MQFLAASPALLCALLLLLTGGRAAVATEAGYTQPRPSRDPILALGDVRYHGAWTEAGAVETFRGIPFAEAPLGDLRWRPPEPVLRPPGDYPAKAFAPVCTQGVHIPDWYRGVVTGFGGDPTRIVNPPESEDCLYLNLWRPAIRDQGSLPLLVYIHGGSNKGGWSWEPNYRGNHLARQGIIVATIAYRLGPFGFFTHPDEPDANFGLRDQLAALRWLRRHAGQIGVDPERITVMGESAGGNDLLALMASPLADGLFQRVAIQSAGWALRGLPTRARSDALGLALEEALLEAPGGIEALRAVDAARLLTAAEDVYAEVGYEPVIDEASLPVPPLRRLDEGAFPTVDVLIGSNEDEWKMYLDEDASLADWEEQGLPVAARENSMTHLEGETDSRRALDRAVTAWTMVCPSLHLASTLAHQGGRSWVYWFTRIRPGEQAAHMGAYHGAELPYVFDTHDTWLPTDEADRDLTANMVAFWANFAATGNPNDPGDRVSVIGQSPEEAVTPAWPAYRNFGDEVMRLDDPLALMPHPERGLCEHLGVSEPQATAP